MCSSVVYLERNLRLRPKTFIKRPRLNTVVFLIQILAIKKMSKFVPQPRYYLVFRPYIEF